MRIAALATMVAVLILAPPALADTAKTSITVPAKVGPDGATTCNVDADLYKPAGVDPAHPAPAILTTNGFGGNKGNQAALAASYAAHGYVALTYSGLGFGASACKIELDSPDWDGKAASAMISYLGGLDFVTHDAKDHSGAARADDPRVGMIGVSYGGEVQFAAAGIDSRLDTIIPQITWNDLAYSLSPNNSSFLSGVTYDPKAPGTEKQEWVSLFFGLGIANTVIANPQGPPDPSKLGACPNFDDQACQIKAKMDATGYADAASIAFARAASVTSYMSKIKIPTFLAQGQTDTLFNLNEAVATYEALRAQGTPVRMLWKSAGHSGGDLGTSEDDQGNLEGAYASRAYLEWFDYYLRGLGDPPKLDFSYYRDWVTYPAKADAAPAVASAPSYPVSGGQPFFLSGAGDLVGSAAAVKAGAPSFQFAPGGPTSYSETSGGQVPNQAPTDAPGTFAAFTSPALTTATDVVGIPKVTVSLTAPAQAAAQSTDPGARLVLFAKLYEIKADGTAVLPHGLIAPVRVQDVTKPVTITLPGIVHRFAAGSKYQLVLAASDAAYKNNNLPGQVTVNVDPKTPSELDIPVLGFHTPATVTQTPGAGQQPQVAQEGRKTAAASLPKTRSCKKNRRVITIHFTGVKKPDHIISRKVTLNGKRRKAGHGRTLKVSLKHRKAGTYRISVLVKSKQGKVRRTARTYKVC